MTNKIITQEKKNIVLELVDKIINRAIETVTEKRRKIQRKHIRKRRRGRPCKANRITWQGEDPEILFKNAALERTLEAKQKLDEYIQFVYKNTTYLSSRGLELAENELTHGRRFGFDNVAHVTIKSVKSGKKRPFYINMNSKKGDFTFREVGENLLSICLTIVESILSNEKLHENTKTWNFTIENNKLKTGSLVYKIAPQRRLTPATRIIDLTREDFWGDDGEFIGERAISSLYTGVDAEHFKNLPPLVHTGNMQYLPKAKVCTNPPPRAGGMQRGISIQNAVISTRACSFAQIDIKRAKSSVK